MKSDAWLLDCAESLKVAVSDRDMLELVRYRQCHGIPATVEYCARVLIWQELVVPVMDLALLHGVPGLAAGEGYVCVLNYRPAAGQPLAPIGLRVASAPQRIVVDDDQRCDGGETLKRGRLRNVVSSCFEWRDAPVLIIDIPRLCSTQFRDLANAA